MTAINKRIVLDAVNHHFAIKQQHITLFDNLSLTINSAKSHAIVGPSGAGKSSLLLILAGLEAPKSGSVSFYDQDVAQSINQLKKQSGFIFQQFQLLPELDAISNIALPLKLNGDKQAMIKARDWLEQVGLGGRADHKPNELSGGEQQRVAIARAFVANPGFVFADEPTGNLDEKTAEQVTDLMFECSRINHTGLVVVTHNKTLAQRADVCFELRGGRLVRQGDQTAYTAYTSGEGS
ncbi:MAG: putative ABC transport system ATP-binding protein [Phenylobacterium sp.]|jgi:putative ABC transport system ATP-binding protein